MKFAPSQTGDINPQSLKFTFAKQAIIVYLYIFARNRYAECQILMYKPIIFANNFGLYINSHQKINMAVYIY